MTLQSSGAISLSNIAAEMGGSTPHSLSEYYRGGGLTPNHGNTSNIPTSGQISFSQFYGANATAPGNTSNAHSINLGTSGLTDGYNAATSLGSMSNNPQSTALTTGLRMEFRYVQWTSICAKTQFEFSYRALAGPTDGTGWSSVSTSFNGNLPRSAFSITGGGNSSTYISCLWSGNTSTRPTTNQSFTVFA